MLAEEYELPVEEGDRRGAFVAIGYANPARSGKARMRVRCMCGRETTIAESSFLGARDRSCNCNRPGPLLGTQLGLIAPAVQPAPRPPPPVKFKPKRTVREQKIQRTLAALLEKRDKKRGIVRRPKPIKGQASLAMRNKSSTKHGLMLEIDGVVRSVWEWSMRSGVRYDVIAKRIDRGVPTYEAIHTPWMDGEYEPAKSMPMMKHCIQLTAHDTTRSLHEWACLARGRKRVMLLRHAHGVSDYYTIHGKTENGDGYKPWPI